MNAAAFAKLVVAKLAEMQDAEGFTTSTQSD
jgi:hypothetical protein